LRRARAIAGAGAVAVVGTACVGILVARGSAREPPSAAPRGNFTLAEARAFGEFPLVWAGDVVDGLRLAAIVRRDDTATYVSFVYGDCRPVSYDSGCAPPAEIQVWPADARNLDSYDSSAPGAPAPEQTRIRGSPAAFFDGGTRLEIYTSRSTVVVFSHPRTRVLAIADALRCLTKGGVEDQARSLDC
jgi:hypothetical protein